MSKKILFLYFTLFILGISFRVDAQCGFIQADKLGNVWVVNRSEILCFNNQLKKIGTYSNLMLGNPYYLDALDPFRVLAFYKDGQSVVVLNNRVSEISKPINLKDKGINEVVLVCRSANGGFWVFDRVTWEILRFDSDFVETGEKIVPEETYAEADPLFMQEYQGFLYIAFKSLGIARFDRFGAYAGIIPVKVDNFFWVDNDSIYYQTNGKLFIYTLESKKTIPCEPQPICFPVKVQEQFLYFDGRELAVHKLK